MITRDPEVPIRRTEFSTADYADALFYAWRDVFGQYPSKEACGVLWAQWALETGRGHLCWNFNIGNVKEIPNDGLPYFKLPGTWEIEDGKRVVLDVKDPGAWFTAFPTLTDGMRHHLRFLATRRYAPAWPAVLAGDPVAFATRLKERGYYTASLAEYAGAMRSLFGEWMRSDVYDVTVAGSLVGHGPEKESPILHPAIEFPPHVPDFDGDA